MRDDPHSGIDELTALRLKLFENGYVPIPNRDKVPAIKGWQDLVVDEGEILSWKGSRASRRLATGLRIEGGLCAIDVDTSNPVLAKQFREDLARIAPEVAAQGLERHGAPVKFALFVRREEADIFYRRQSRRWVRPEDADKEREEREDHLVEIFGGGKRVGRQFGCFGPHSHDDQGNVLREYRWPGRSPVDVPLSDLPILEKAQSFALIEAFDQRATPLGYVPVKTSQRGETVPKFLYDLTAEMRFDTNDGDVGVRLADLEDALFAASHHGIDLRVSSSFLGHGTNLTKCHVGWSNALKCITVHDYETAITHLPADRKPIEDEQIAEIMKLLPDHAQHRAPPAMADGPGEMAEERDEVDAVEELMPPLPPPPTPGDPEQQKGAFQQAVSWLAANCGLLVEGEVRGSGRVIPLRTRVATSTALAAFRTKMLPYRLERIGPRGAITRISPVDTWLSMPGRIEIAGCRMAPDKPWPTFTEDGATYVNLYRRPDLPENGDPSLGHQFLEALLRNPAERGWFKQWLGYKLKHPEVPGVGVVMVARDRFGTGRGTLFQLLKAMFGQHYIAAPEFSTVIGEGSQGQYNHWMADNIMVLVNETSAADDNRRQRRREAYERLKELVDTARRPRLIVRKYEHSYTTECGPSFIFASNHAAPLALADGDRRLSFLTNGPAQPPAFWDAINAWIKVKANVGAFRRDLEAVDLAGYTPYHPLHTRLKDVVVDEARSLIDEAIDAAIEALPGEIVLREQVVDAVSVMRTPSNWPTRSEWVELVKKGVEERLHRIGILGGRNWRPTVPERGKRLPVYARSEERQKLWTAVEPAIVMRELQKNEQTLEQLRQTGGRTAPIYCAKGTDSG